jgi:hypothetical protein
MPCARENDAILSLTEFGLTAPERQDFETHLAGCEECRILVERHRQFIAQSLRENGESCRQIQDHLVEYLLGEIKQVAGVKIKSHLKDCPHCLLLYQDLRRSLPEEEWAEIRQPLPQGLRARFFFGQVPDQIAGIKEKLRQEGVAIINLFIQNLALEPAFMGEPVWGARKIRHAGGDLVIYLGAPDKTVRLLTAGKRELETLQSDAGGFVRFHDYTAGDYHIQIEGAEILAVKHEKLK